MEKAKAHAISIIIFISTLLFLFFGGRAIVLWQLDEAITTRLAKLKQQGIEIDFSKMDVALWSKNLNFENIKINFKAHQPLASTTIEIPNLSISGFSIIPLIAKKEIVINTISITKPRATIYYSDSIHAAKEKLPRFTVKIGNLLVDTLFVQIIDKATSTTRIKANLSASVKQLNLFTTDSLNWTAEVINMKDIAIDLPTYFYQIKTKQLTFNSSLKQLRLDSIELKPTLARLEFARKSIYQIDQITACVPSLTARGFEISETVQPRFNASSVELSFKLDVFHDKRFPMAKGQTFMLPSQFMHSLGFPIQIDTLNINSSYISYDELPINGEKAGSIFFNNLNATLSNLSTNTVGETKMEVNARFMNAGNLIALFTFPLEMHKPYTVKGSLRDFNLPAINQMLTPLEHLKIETGHLMAMDFQFKYNEQNAIGALILNYSDLHISIFKKNNPTKINVLASFVANALLKNTMDKNIVKTKRTGSIQFNRDPTEGIFGFWWKSLREGIKSVFTVEKIMSRDHKKKVRE